MFMTTIYISLKWSNGGLSFLLVSLLILPTWWPSTYLTCFTVDARVTFWTLTFTIIRHHTTVLAVCFACWKLTSIKRGPVKVLYEGKCVGEILMDLIIHLMLFCTVCFLLSSMLMNVMKMFKAYSLILSYRTDWWQSEDKNRYQ